MEGFCRSQMDAKLMDLYDEQKEIFTPFFLFEQCCPKFLANGKEGKLGCLGCCGKDHPSITLYFEAGVVCSTVAVLSHQLDPFLSYLEGRTNQKPRSSATKKSPFYYVLDGFVRENLNDLKRHGGFGFHLVTVAIDSLSESDTAQKRQLALQRTRARARALRLFCQPQHSGSTPGVVPSSSFLLEAVLDICTSHRLGDDLDVVSTYFLGLASQITQKIARRIAAQRMADLQVVVTPLVDGCLLAGHSVFRRFPSFTTTEMRDTDTTNTNTNTNNNNNNDDDDDDDHDSSRHHHRSTDYTTVLHQEHGNIVEYSALDPIRMVPRKMVPLHEEKEEDGNDQYLEAKTTLVPSTAADGSGLSEFSWDCEEMSFAYLERGWGNVSLNEYLGQKLMVEWIGSDAERTMPPDPRSSRRRRRRSSRSTRVEAHHQEGGGISSMPIASIPLPSSDTSHGMKKIVVKPHFVMNIQVLKNHVHRVDEVTAAFSGVAEIKSIQLDFLYLVRESARSMEGSLLQRYAEIQEERPLLDHEEAYLRRIHSLGDWGR